MTWEDFWLNEGITTFLERKIIGRLGGEKERHLDYISEWCYIVYMYLYVTPVVMNMHEYMHACILFTCIIYSQMDGRTSKTL